MKDYTEQFSLIYDQYIEKIYRFVYLKVSSQEIAEDITSKVFLRGWERFQKGPDKIDNTGAFLYQVARNSVIDYYREKGRANMVSPENVPEITDNKVNLQEKAILGSDIEIVKSAISKLKQDYQDVVIWHYLDGMDVSEIALAMDKPVGTIRVMLHRGLKALREELEGKIKES
jgi:RNA polymerase sigma-70 factor (ECF subfamily)